MSHVTAQSRHRSTPPLRARLAIVVVVAALCGLVGWAPVPAHADPYPTDHCPHKVNTPPAVDTSEVPGPGETVPTALPVHTPPVGGDGMAHCGIITASAAPQLSTMAPAGWLIADLDSGKVLAAKDPHGRYRPASTIKVLLALVSLRELDLDKTVSVSAEDYSAEGDSCGTGPGGSYTIRELLTGLLMVSGNDCASALAHELGGTAEALKKMNDMAKSLQAFDTRAASPSGLDAPGMSTSPYDEALIFRAAMRIDTFRQIIAMKTFHFPGYPRNPAIPEDKDHPGYLMQSQDALLLDDYPGMLGGKTGFTDDARKTFVGAADRGGRTVVIVMMYGLNTRTSSDYWDQAKLMFEYGQSAPAEHAVGQLVDSSTVSTASSTTPVSSTSQSATTPARPATVEHRAATGADQPTNWLMRILIGSGAALAALLLVLVGMSINRR